MTSASDVTVNDYRTQLDHRIATLCLGKGYSIANSNGIALEYINLSAGSLGGVIGLLYDHIDQSSMPRRFFGLIGPKKLRRILLGHIWTTGKSGAAGPENWVFDVYGRINMAQAVQLANELAETFRVSIHVKLTQDLLRYEAKHSDYDW